MTKFIFWAQSIKGLVEDVELVAHTYAQARVKVLRYIALNKTNKHPVRGVKSSVWE